jgi:hypothetical protein
MKKKYSFIIIIFIATILSLLIALSSMGFIIKKTVNQVTHNITGTDAELDRSSLSLLTGKATLGQLLIASPKGSKAPLALKMTSAKMKIKASSVTKDIVIIENFESDNIELFWDGVEGKNLQIIMNNITEFAIRERGIIEDITSRGLEDEHKYFALENMLLKNVKLHLITGDKKQEIIIPTIKLQNVGDAKKGASFVDLMEKSFKEIIVTCEKHINEHIISQEKISKTP